MEGKIINTADIQDYLFNGLIRAGYSPDCGELDVVSDLVFDYLIHCGAMEVLEEE